MSTQQPQPNLEFDWCVIGAGPAGMATVGKLIDAGVNPKRLAWIDPLFQVGDFGTKWRNVSSNTRAGLFIEFLNACRAFEYDQCEHVFDLHAQDPTLTCTLHLMSEPLAWITQRLRSQVTCFVSAAQALDFCDNTWRISLAHQIVRSHNVVLAIGAEPKSRATMTNASIQVANMPELLLADAMDEQRLARLCFTSDTVAVFGSSHSAILIIRSLLEVCKVQRVINFYQQPLCYAEYMGDWIRFDDTGLKGNTAQWARENIDGQCPTNLERFESTIENQTQHLWRCDKVVYAIGFSPRNILVNGAQQPSHNPTSGVIAPGLFGVGIAFPEAKVNRDGLLEHRVGLWKFMQYIGDCVPLWVAQSLGQ